jgi:DNA-binding NarL/FixJ family response regulator
MSRPEKIRVLVVDDHPVVCRGLAAIIQAEPGMSVIGQAADRSQAVRMCREHTPDITLMDLRVRDERRGGDPSHPQGFSRRTVYRADHLPRR